MSEEKPHNLDSQAVETFAFEVSAGRPAHLDVDQITSPKALQPTLTTPASDVAPTSAPIPVAVEIGAEAAEFTAPAESPRLVDAVPKELLAVKLARRQSSWWMVSLGLHVLLLVVLAFSTLVVLREKEELELYVSPAVYEVVEEFEDLEIDANDELESLEEDLASEIDEPEAATLADLTSENLFEAETLNDSVVDNSIATEMSDSLGDMSDLFGDGLSEQVGNGKSELGSGSGGSMAKFFGTEVKARRILYMLDNSGGMRKGGKFEALVSELLASISALEGKQQFYVVFYSDTVYPMFYPQSIRKFVSANDRNRKQLARWLDTVELCGGNAIDEALAAAEVIRPEVIFLLTDGDLFTTEKKKSLLLNRMGRPYPIHTFGLGVGEDTKTAERLKQVAEANAGSFRAIEITSEMKELAREKERPYHSKEPGAIWGLKVGSR